MYFSIPAMFLMLICYGQRLCQCIRPVVEAAGLHTCFRQHAKLAGEPDLRLRCAIRGHRFSQLRNVLVAFALFDHRPVAHESRKGRPDRKSMLTRKGYYIFCSALSFVRFPSKLMDDTEKNFITTKLVGEPFR